MHVSAIDTYLSCWLVPQLLACASCLSYWLVPQLLTCASAVDTCLRYWHVPQLLTRASAVDTYLKHCLIATWPAVIADDWEDGPCAEGGQRWRRAGQLWTSLLLVRSRLLHPCTRPEAWLPEDRIGWTATPDFGTGIAEWRGEALCRRNKLRRSEK